MNAQTSAWLLVQNGKSQENPLGFLVNHCYLQHILLVFKYECNCCNIFFSSCDDFIQFCEIHQTYYFASNSNETCCGTIFNTTPFFSPTGTCFTTQKEVIENLPFAFSSIKVWLNLHNDNATGTTLISNYQFLLGQWSIRYKFDLGIQFRIFI